MKPSQNVRRIIPRNMLNEPTRDRDGIVQTIALPRGKLYPYSSARQNERPLRQGLKRLQRLVQQAGKAKMPRTQGLLEERILELAGSLGAA